MNTKDWYPLGWTGPSPCSPRDSQESSPTSQFKSINSLRSAFYSPTLNPYLATGKTIPLTRQIFDAKVMSLHFIFNTKVFILMGGYLFYIWYCFCHISTRTCHRCTCVPHPVPLSYLPPRTIPLGDPSAPAQASCIIHRTWTSDSFHIWYYTCFNAILPNHPTLSHRLIAFLYSV